MTHHTLKPQIDELKAEHTRLGSRIAQLETLCRHRSAQNAKADEINAAVCEAFGVEDFELSSSARPRRIADARMAAMAIMRETIEGIILEDVSGYYGRTHGAAINAIEVTNNLRATDPIFRRRYESVMQRVKSLTEK